MGRCQYACRCHLQFRWQPGSQFSLNFISLTYLRIYPMKLVFDFWQGREFTIVESLWIKLFSVSNQIIFCFESRIVLNHISNQKFIMYLVLSCLIWINLLYFMKGLGMCVWGIKAVHPGTIWLDKSPVTRCCTRGQI